MISLSINLQAHLSSLSRSSIPLVFLNPYHVNLFPAFESFKVLLLFSDVLFLLP